MASYSPRGYSYIPIRSAHIIPFTTFRTDANDSRVYENPIRDAFARIDDFLKEKKQNQMMSIVIAFKYL